MDYTLTDLDISLMKQASLLCDNAKCGYKVGCVLEKGGQVLQEAWNTRLNGDHYCLNGTCIREEQHLSGGKEIEKVCSIHAESLLVAKCASEGITTKECNLYITTFPCLICSRLLSQTKIAKMFYMSDYMGKNLGKPILEKAGITLIQIPLERVWNKDD